MKPNKPRIQSKAYWTALSLTLFSLIGDHFEIFRPFLEGQADIAYQIISLVIVLLRERTDRPVSGVVKAKQNKP